MTLVPGDEKCIKFIFCLITYSGLEAARAGQAGKGFGVVASEVKLLATQSGKATEEIAAQVLAVQSSTNETIEAINRITSRMQEISQYTSAVAASVENQNV